MFFPLCDTGKIKQIGGAYKLFFYPVLDMERD